MANVCVNGELFADSDATISIYDHGLVVGDGAFETLLLFHGRPFALGRHLARLNRSLAGLMITEVDNEEIASNVARVVDSCDFSEGRIRITVTAGTGPLGSGRDEGPPSIIIAAAQTVESHEFSHVHTVPWPRNERGALVGLKTISYAENAVGLAYAKERQADEAIFANTAGYLCEGSGSNVFVVLDDELCTPPRSAGCLAGITRGLVIELGNVTERNIAATDFHPSIIREAFLTSAIRGVQPISMINHVPFAVVPGPQTIATMERYNSLRETNPEP